MKLRHFIQKLGPGLLFASSAIGTSHLVLATRAGAHHGFILVWVILFTLFLKYPFYYFGPKYAMITGHSLIHAYRKQGLWAIAIFFTIISFNMFAVTAAVSAVCAGLISSLFGLEASIQYLVIAILILSATILILGKYSALDHLVKLISVILLITVSVVFIAALWKGPLVPSADFVPPPIFKDAGLILLVSLIGWMPNGMEGSTMNSVWVAVKSEKDEGNFTMKDALLDFNIGYGMTTFLAVVFLAIGALSSFGSAAVLDGNSTQFSNKLLNIFTHNLGAWSIPIFAASAIGVIYGTLITAWDAFARCFVRSLQAIKAIPSLVVNKKEDSRKRLYTFAIGFIGIGAYLLFSQFPKGMIQMLEYATILSFLTAPFIAYFNLRAMQSSLIPTKHHPSKGMRTLSYTSLCCMILFAVFYVYKIWIIG